MASEGSVLDKHIDVQTRTQVESTRSNSNFFEVDERVPKIGMEFGTEEAAYEFYNDYSAKIGFSVRRGWKWQKNDIIRMRNFCCSKEGQKIVDKRNRVVRNPRPRPETRTGCLAHMVIKLIGDKYQVTHFESSHNHTLLVPTNVPFKKSKKSRRCMCKSQAVLVESGANVGILPNDVIALQSNQAGGQKKLAFLALDLKTCLRTKRQKVIEKGVATALLEYFKRKQNENPSFFYSIQLDEDSLITNIFWADARMMVDYECFGDLVSFNTTYRTDNNNWPCALFTGVNHHQQDIIFGAALLYDETVESFIWLFETFLVAMSGKKPITVITDQCVVISKAMRVVMPGIHHRLCILHIYQNASIHLSHIFNKFQSFARDLKQCMFEYETEEEFLEGWNMMLQKYTLQEQPWLQQLFGEREKWAMAYGRHIFCAGMKITQCSESMNSILMWHVTSRINPIEFLCHFDRLVEDRRFEELQADFKMVDRIPKLPFFSKMIAQMAKVYTPAAFEIFQIEYQDHLDCEIHEYVYKGTTMEFRVKGKHGEHNVTFDSQDQIIVCSCKNFEFSGIPCSHSLKVFDNRCVKMLPPQCIMRRWTRDAKVWVISNGTSTSDADQHKAMGRRFMELSRMLIAIAARGAESEAAYKATINQAKIMSQVVDKELKHIPQDEDQPDVSNVYVSQLKEDINANNLELVASGLKRKG